MFVRLNMAASIRIPQSFKVDSQREEEGNTHVNDEEEAAVKSYCIVACVRK